MVGKKLHKNIESQKSHSSKKLSVDENTSNTEFILDLDELHMNVTPPSELNDNHSHINENEIGKSLKN